MAGTTARQINEFGPYRLDAANRLLYRDGQIVPLSPKVVDTLLVLVENVGSVVDKETLLRRVWPDTFVDENNLAQNISVLRRMLGNGDFRIETIVGNVQNRRSGEQRSDFRYSDYHPFSRYSERIPVAKQRVLG